MNGEIHPRSMNSQCRRVYRTRSSTPFSLEDLLYWQSAMSSTSPPTKTSPTRNAINAIGAKLTRAWSRDSTGVGTESEVSSLKSGVDEYIRECFL